MALRVDPEGREIKALTRALNLANRDILEIGCGDGRLTFRYAQLTRHVYAFDQFLESIASARENTPPELRARVQFYVGSAEHLSLPPGRFDLALMAWSL